MKKDQKTIIFGERVRKTTAYPEGWKKLFEENDAVFQSPENIVGKRGVIIFPGNGADTERAINGACKGVIEFLRASDISIEQMPHIYGVGYASRKDEEHRQEVYTNLGMVRYGDSRKHPDNPTPAEDYYIPFFREYIMPLIVDKNGKPKDLVESKKNLANITFISHCHGSIFAFEIEKMLAQKSKELYHEKAKELMNQVKMIHFNSRYPIGCNFGSRQFHVVSQSDPKYADDFLSYDNIHKQMHRSFLKDEVALIPVHNQEEILLMNQFTPSSKKNMDDPKNDDHTIPMPVFSNTKNPRNPQEIQSPQNQKAIKLTQDLIKQFVLYPEDNRTPHEILFSLNTDFVKHAESIGKEFEKERLSQSKTDKELLSLLTDLDGVKIENLSTEFLLQKGKDGKYLYDVLFEKCIKNNSTTNLENLIKKIGAQIPTRQIEEGIRYAVKSENWSLLNAYVKCSNTSVWDFSPNRSKLPINQFFPILKNVSPQHLISTMKNLLFNKNSESVFFMDHMLEISKNIPNSAQRVKTVEFLNKKRLEILQELDTKNLKDVLKAYSMPQKKSLKEILHDKRIKGANEIKKLMAERDKGAPELKISDIKEFKKLESQYSSGGFNLDNFRQFKKEKKDSPALTLDTFVQLKLKKIK